MQLPNAATSAPFARPGTLIDDKYLVDEVIGKGGMSVVVSAVHITRRAPVALKLLNGAVLNQEGSSSRLLREAIATSSIATEHVVKIFDVGRLPSGFPYLVMELLRGQSLNALLEREGSPGLPVSRAVYLVLQLLRGLQAVHARGIIHRDLKLSNCFITHFEGEPDFLKILDFGVSKVRLPDESVLTRTDTRLGTDAFMSPEQATSPGDVTNVADLYSAGIVLYKLVSGRLPFDLHGTRSESLARLMSAAPTPVLDLVPSLPRELAEVIHKAFERDPSARFQTAASFAEALAPWADGKSIAVLERIRVFERESTRPKGATVDVDAVLERWRQARESGESETRPGALTATPNAAATAPATTSAASATAPSAASEPDSAASQGSGSRTSMTASRALRSPRLSIVARVLLTGLAMFVVAFVLVRWLLS